MSTIQPPPAPTNPAEQSGGNAALRLIQLIEELHRTIKTQTKDPEFLETVINGVSRRLLESEALVSTIDRMIVERLRLLSSGNAAVVHHEDPQLPAPKLLGMEAQLHAIVGEDKRYELKVQCRPANHPALPLTLEAYHRDGDGHWKAVDLAALSKQAIREALRRQNAENGVFYWAEFFQITDRPVPGLPSTSMTAPPPQRIEAPAPAVWPTEELARQLIGELRDSEVLTPAVPFVKPDLLPLEPAQDADPGRFVSPVTANDAVFSPQLRD